MLQDIFRCVMRPPHWSFLVIGGYAGVLGTTGPLGPPHSGTLMNSVVAPRWVGNVLKVPRRQTGHRYSKETIILFTHSAYLILFDLILTKLLPFRLLRNAEFWTWIIY